MNAHRILMLLLVTTVLFTMMSAGAVVAQGETETIEFRGSVEDSGAIGPITWTANNWQAFYLDINNPATATETLAYVDAGGNSAIGASPTNNVIDKDELTYTTGDVNVMYHVVANLPIITKISTYSVMSWLGEQHVAIDGDAQKITKLVLEQDDNDIMTLRTGESWDLGNGYTLTPAQIDVADNKVWLELSKDGNLLDSKIPYANKTADDALFVSKANFADKTNVVFFVTYVDAIFTDTTSDIVRLKYTWLIDKDDIITIEADDQFGNFQCTAASANMITLSNDNTFNLNYGTRVPLLPDMYFNVSDAGKGIGGGYLFYPAKDVTTPGIYELRGSVKDTGIISSMIWTAANWPALYYDIDDPMEATETLVYVDAGLSPAIGIPGSGNNVMDKGELMYTTSDVPKPYGVFTNVPGVTEVNFYSVMAWLGEQYVAIDGDAQKITKLLFEQDVQNTRTLGTGETWNLGNGYALSLAGIDIDGNKVWLVLSKDGVVIEDEILDIHLTANDALFVAKANFAGKSDEVYFVTYVESLNTTEDNVQLKYTWLIDKDDVTTISTDDTFGNFRCTGSTSNMIVLSNNNAITLNMDDEVPFLQDIYFRVSKAGKGADGVSDYLFYPAMDVLVGNDLNINVPVLDPIGPKSVDENETLTFTLTASDADGDSLTYSVVGLPSGAIFDESTGVFTWTPVYGQAKTYLMQFTVTDGILTDSETIMITVNYKEYFNLAGNATILWESTITDSISDAWNIGDVTGDDISDILLVDRFGSAPILTLYSGANGNEIWTSTINVVPDWDDISFEDIGDFDGDGVNDILMTVNYYTTGTSYTIAIKGTDGSQLWQKQESDNYIWMYSIGDVNGDAKDDIVYEYYEYGSHQNLSIISGDNGSPIWTYTESISSESWGEIYSLGDLDRDDIGDFFIYRESEVYDSTDDTYYYDSQLRAISGKTGFLIWNKTSEYIIYDSIPDINGDGYDDVVISMDDQTSIVRGYDANQLHTIDGYLVGTIYDVNGNGFNDIVVSDNNNLIALDGKTWNTIWTKPVPNYVYFYDLFSIGDENEDDVNDLIARSYRDDYSTSLGYDAYSGISGRDGSILWNKEFERIHEQNYETNSYIDAIVDLGRNGKQYIVINRESWDFNSQSYNNWTAIKGSDGEILWNLNKSKSGNYWPTYMDFNNDGIFDVLDYGSYLPSSSSLTAEPAVKSVPSLSKFSTSLSQNDYQLPERNQRYSDNFIRNIELNRQKFSSTDASSIVSTSAVQSSVTSIPISGGSSGGSGGEYIQSYARMFSGDSIENTLWSVDSDTRIIPINHEWWDYYYNNPNDLNSDEVSDVVLLNGDKMYALTDGTTSSDNVAPIAHGQNKVTNEDTSVDITLSATDVDGDLLTYSIVDGPANGTVSLGGTINIATYTPNANFSGTDSFTFKANDGTVYSDTATVSITVIAVNDAPVANSNGPYTGTEGTEITFDGSASSDPDGTIDLYNWDFGDGNSGTGVTPTHVYGHNGTYTVTLTVTDNDGATDSNSTHVVVGNIAPTVSILSPSSITNDSTPLLRATFDQTAASFWHVIDMAAGSGGTNADNLTVILPELADGEHTVTVYANNSYGNVGSATKVFLVDTIVPTVDSVTLNDTVVQSGASIEVNVSATDDGSAIVSVTANGSALVFTDGYYIGIITAGISPVIVNVTDEAGNMATNNYASYAIDDDAPSVDSVTLNDTVVQSGASIEVNVSATDANKIVSVTANSSELTLTDGYYIGTITAGVSPVIVSVTDEAGNMATNISATYTIDDIAPSVSVTLNNTVVKSGTSIEVNVSATDANEIVTVTINDSAVILTDGYYIGKIIAGASPVIVNVTDEAGNMATDISATYTIDDTKPVVNISEPQQNDLIRFVDNIVRGTVKDANFASAQLIVRNETDGIVGLPYDLIIEADGSFIERVEYAPDQNNTLELNATDLAGNSNSTIVQNISVQDNKVHIEDETVEQNKEIIIDAINETDAQLVVNANVNTSINVTITAITDVTRLDNLSNSSALSALGNIVEIHVDGINASNTSEVNYVTVRMYYTKADLDLDGNGVIETGDLDEENISIYWYNDTNDGNWVKLIEGNPSWVNDVGRMDTGDYSGYVWAKIHHLSVFGLAAGSVLESTGDDGDGNNNGNSGGGGGGGSSGEAYGNIAVKEVIRNYVSADTTNTYRFKEDANAISFVTFDAKTNAGEIAVIVEVLKNTSAMVSTPPSGKVYQNMNILVGMSGYATEKNIADPVIGFKVAKLWITENDIDESTIKLNRHSSGVWNQLPTTKTSEDDSYIYLSSETPGFSPFAITGNERSSTVAETQDMLFSPPSADDGVNEPVGETANVPEAESSSGLILIIGLIAISVLGVGMYLRKNKIGK